MDRIVLATDGSTHSHRAALFTGELSAKTDTPVDIIHVIPETLLVAPSPVTDYTRIERTYIAPKDLATTSGRAVVDEAAEMIRAEGGTVEELEVVIGNPAQSIVEFADLREADIIVMGRRGLGDFKGLLMGSVSHKVGHLSEATLITTGE